MRSVLGLFAWLATSSQLIGCVSSLPENFSENKTENEISDDNCPLNFEKLSIDAQGENYVLVAGKVDGKALASVTDTTSFYAASAGIAYFERSGDSSLIRFQACLTSPCSVTQPAIEIKTPPLFLCRRSLNKNPPSETLIYQSVAGDVLLFGFGADTTAKPFSFEVTSTGDRKFSIKASQRPYE